METTVAQEVALCAIHYVLHDIFKHLDDYLFITLFEPFKCIFVSEEWNLMRKGTVYIQWLCDGRIATSTPK